MSIRFRKLSASIAFSLLGLPLGAQQSQDPGATPAPVPQNQKMSKQQKQKMKKTLKELDTPYRTWLEEDVVYIITPDERNAFLQLETNEEREQFIEQFWLRRSSNPDLPDNDFKEEHYRRIAYANEHFAAGIPGWKTDRGRIYIVWGKPDEIESHPAGGTYERPIDEGGGTTSTFPFEQWRYRYLEGVEGPHGGQEVIIEFVDTCMCGDYHMTIDRSEKDALLHTPNGGLTLYEELGMASKASRFAGGGLENLGTSPMSSDQQTKQFDRLQQFASLTKPPPV